MKYSLSLVLVFIIGFAAIGQDCSGFYYMQNNKVIEMSFTNKKGKSAGKNVYSISNVSKSGGTTTATVSSEMFDQKGKTVSKAVNNMKCANGTIMMDMKMFIPSGQQQQMGNTATAASDVYIDYPSGMKEGDALKDGKFSMDFKTEAGMNGSISVDITNRKVAGKETITTTAGTWECFKITYNSKINFKILVGIPIKMDVTEWYAPGFGVVKSDSNGFIAEITSVK